MSAYLYSFSLYLMTHFEKAMRVMTNSIKIVDNIGDLYYMRYTAHIGLPANMRNLDLIRSDFEKALKLGFKSQLNDDSGLEIEIQKFKKEFSKKEKL